MTSEQPKRLALDYLLSEAGNLALPSQCCDCPFAEPDPQSDPPNPADPGEGHYLCVLLGPHEVQRRNSNRLCWTYRLTTVWGENPLCQPEDWRRRALEELL